MPVKADESREFPAADTGIEPEPDGIGWPPLPDILFCGPVAAPSRRRERKAVRFLSLTGVARSRTR